MAMTILIPAAGSATRMRGGDKLLEQVCGQAMLRHQASLALLVCPDVLVTLRDPDPARLACLDGLNLIILTVADAGLGMSASLRHAAHVITGPLMILPADMPDLTTADLQTLIGAFNQAPDSILRAASAAGIPGHPVIFPERFLPDIVALRGDEGARSILARNPVRLMRLPGENALTDLDTPEDWAAWRTRQATSNTRTS